MKKRWMIGGLESLLPPNADKESTVSQCTGIGVMGGAASAVWFLIRYGEARSNLYTYSSSLQRRVLTGEKIEPFSHFAGCAGWLMAFFLFMLLVWMGMLYASFSQGSRSLYLMGRLPKGRRIMAGAAVVPGAVRRALRGAAGRVLPGVAVCNADGMSADLRREGICWKRKILRNSTGKRRRWRMCPWPSSRGRSLAFSSSCSLVMHSLLSAEKGGSALCETAFP